MCGIWQFFLKNSNKLSENEIANLNKMFKSFSYRGPDAHNFITKENTIIGFHRLAINGLNPSGMQPFIFRHDNATYHVICNGEIYNHMELEKELDETVRKNIVSGSDCEFLAPYFATVCNDDIDMFLKKLNGEYALVITKIEDGGKTDVYLGTDQMSVRPMFYKEMEDIGGLIISSLLCGLRDRVDFKYTNYKNHRLNGGEYRHYTQIDGFVKLAKSGYYYVRKPRDPKYTEETPELYHKIVSTLEKTVERRLMTERDIIALVSGGIDSCSGAAILSRLMKKNKKYDNKKLKTITIFMSGGGSDRFYANMLAKHIDADHIEVEVDIEEALRVVDNVIETCETFDITTVRASVWEYLLAKYIAEHTDCKVVFNGDGADEVQMGYLYNYLCPNREEGDKDRIMRCNDICKFDGLRVDRNISHFGLEARVMYEDNEFEELYADIAYELKVPSKQTGRKEKQLIRNAFNYVYKDDPLMPEDITNRQKEAFSDGVSHTDNSWYAIFSKELASRISDEEYMEIQKSCENHCPPHTKESAYLRKRFIELFGEESVECIPYFWLHTWSGSLEPSARTLSVY